jgi:hypothetical protein
MIDSVTEKSLQNKIIADQRTTETVSDYFLPELIPNLLLPYSFSLFAHFTIKNPINFKMIALDHLQSFQRKDEQKRHEDELLAEIENKYLSSQTLESSTAGKLENIINKLKIGFNDIDKYMASNSADMQLNEKVHKMLFNLYDNFKIEISRLIIK